MHLIGHTIFITGASRGIGKAIALRLAKEGANIAIAAKTTDPNPKLPGTIHETVKEIESIGGHAIGFPVDVRFPEQIQQAIEATVAQFGGLDGIINNAGAIRLTNTANTSPKDFDLMMGINVRASHICAHYALPYLKQSKNPHILNLSPPLSLDKKWFKNHVTYTISKFGMSMLVLGMAEEFKADGIAVNALWPKTIIDTAALRMINLPIKPEQCRKPEIVADAACAILSKDSKTTTGHFFLDEDVLRAEGVENFDQYAVAPGNPLLPDLFV